MQHILRIKKLQIYLRKNALDVFLVLTKVNREYLSGFTGSKGILLITPKVAKLFVDDRYTIRAKKESDLAVLPLPRLKATLSGKGRGKFAVGVEDEITLYQMQKLKKQVKGVRWAVTRRIVDHIRAQKTSEEIKYTRKGAQIIDATFLHIKKLLRHRLKSGISEVEIALEIERFGLSRGANKLAFDPIVAFGPNAAAPHHDSSTRKKIGRNNFLLLDFGFVVHGYHSDFTRTLFVGQPNRKQEKIYKIVQEAHARAVSVVAPHMIGAEIDSIARGFIEKNGYKDHFTHCTGHGVGLEIHEAPNLCADSQEELLENTVVTIEPGVYLDGWGGVRIEDMVLVKKIGVEILSRISKNFKEMIIS